MAKSDNKLTKRIITAIVIAAMYVGVVVLTLWLRFPAAYDVFVLFNMLAAGCEMGRAATKRFGKPMRGIVIGVPLIGYAAFYFVHNGVGKGSGGITAFFGVLFLAIIAAIVYNMFSKKNTMRNVASTLLTLVYPIALMVYSLALNYPPAKRYWAAAILLVFLVPVLTDTFAYVIGSIIKGPKLLQKVSPNKTISGAIGGLVGGLVAGAVVLMFSIMGWGGVQKIGDYQWTNIALFLSLGFFGSLFDQAGDLIASYVKRFCNIKDYGNMLPGHGGVLDRIDGTIITAVFIYVFISVLAIWRGFP